MQIGIEKTLPPVDTPRMTMCFCVCFPTVRGRHVGLGPHITAWEKRCLPPVDSYVLWIMSVILANKPSRKKAN